MVIITQWDRLADERTLEATVRGLNANGFVTFIVDGGEEAKRKALELIPDGAEVLTVSSTTVASIGLDKELNESKRYKSVRNELNKMDREAQKKEMVRLGSSPDWVVGSVHAITVDGKAIIASASGSQIPPYAYGANHVLWIVGTHKIVKDIDEGIRRINERSLPMESERARKAYGVPGSVVAKLLIMQKEQQGSKRVTVIFVKEVLGF